MWAVAALTTGCGGGGGDSGAAPSPSPAGSPSPAAYNLRAAWQNFLTSTGTHSWSVSGTASDHKAYTLTLSTAPGLSQVFPVNGNTYATSDATVGFGLSGLALTSTVTRNFYDATTFAVAGTRTTINAQTPTCSAAAAAATALPTAAHIGDSGTLESFNDLNGCVQSSTTTGSSSVTAWSLQNAANPAPTAGALSLFCQLTTVRNTSGTQIERDSICIEVSPDGTLGSRAWVDIEQSGFSFIGTTTPY